MVENRPVGISSVPGLLNKSNMVPNELMAADNSPKSNREETSTTPLYSNVGQSLYQNVMSRISSEPQVDLSAFQKVQDSLHNMEYRMEKLENRINALTENIKQIVMDQRRSQKYVSDSNNNNDNDDVSR